MLERFRKLRTLQKAVKTSPEESQAMVNRGYFSISPSWQHSVQDLGNGMFHHAYKQNAHGRDYWFHHLSSSPNPGESVHAEAQVAGGHSDDLYQGDPWNKGSYPVLSTMKTLEPGQGHGRSLMHQLVNHHKALATDYKMSDSFHHMIAGLPQDKFDVHLSPFYEDTNDRETRQQRHFVKLKGQ